MRAVMFDMDGVLIDSEPIYDAVEVAMLKARGIVLDDETRQMLVGTQMTKLWQLIIERFGITEAREALIEEEKRLFRKHLLAGEIAMVPGAKALVKAVYDAGYKTAVVSSSGRVEVETVIEQYGLTPYIHTQVAAEDVQCGKPDPEPYLLAAEKLGVLPKNCVVIEDSGAGIRSGAEAGMCTIALKLPHALTQDFSRADQIVSAMSEISVDSIARILK